MVATSTNDPYAVLGVDRSATDATIAAAHRKLARTFHPDVAGEDATVQMMRINAAFDRIRDRKRRVRHAVEEAEDRGTTPARSDASTNGTIGTVRPHDGSRRWTPERDGTGGAGRPPGRPSGSVLGFGRHIDWSIGEIARVDPGYLVWLEDRKEGLPYLDEIDRTLRHVGHRRPEQQARSRGPLRR
jgi:curved DNA-binding protein CbpA